MNRTAVLLAVTGGVAVGSFAWGSLRPPRRLRSRTLPYVQVARTRLLRGADPETYLLFDRAAPSVRTALAPAVDRLARFFTRLVGSRDEAQLALRLRQSGLYPDMSSVERLNAYRHRLLGTSFLTAAFLGWIGWQWRGASGLLVYGAGGLVLGGFIARGRIDKAIEAHRERIRSELYTINQVLAMRARVGGGVGDAMRHVSQRGSGVIADEIAEILDQVRSGTSTGEALRRAAARTSEPEASRLYHSLAIAHERGVDLADSLFALAQDLRNARREEAATTAAKRRVAAVVPIVIVLAPIAIAFVAAPLPSLIFGGGGP